MTDFHNNIPTIIFGILGLSITIATFLPALVYSYNKDLLKNLKEPKWEKNQTVWKRVISFINTNDLLLTQSMMQVLFASIYAILIFSKNFIVYTSDIGKFRENCIFLLLISIALFCHWRYAYFYSKRKIKEFEKGDNTIIKYFWCDFKKTVTWWKRVILTNLIITTLVLLWIFWPLNDNDIVKNYIIYFMAYMSLVLIAFSVSWLLPLIIYSPLQSEIVDYAKIYQEKSNNSSYPISDEDDDNFPSLTEC